jgi:hypothetical protein
MGNKGIFSKRLKNSFRDFEFLYHIGYLVFGLLGLWFHEFFYSLLVSIKEQSNTFFCNVLLILLFTKLLDVVYREETLLNVIRCVTKNAKSVLLTAVFAVILIYLFSICGYLFLRDDFLIEVDPIQSIIQVL